jgi:shikimate dehydrogenase
MSAPSDPTLTLADLQQRDFPGTPLAVLGHPIAHSLSPRMHNAALAELAQHDPRFRDWHYHKFDIAPADLPAALTLFHQKNFFGLNLTVPHKSLVLDQLVATDDFVRVAGAANTLTRTATGWQGANTDGYGLTHALQADLAVTPAGHPVILLGAGGAARGAALECLRAGCTSLSIGNRTAATAEALLADLAAHANRTPLRTFNPSQPHADLPPHAIVINATSLGLAAGDAAPVDLAKIPRPAAVFDMIYRPAQTPLLRQAAALGLPHANGVSMLVHQGARSLQIWSGVQPPVATMQAAVRAAL